MSLKEDIARLIDQNDNDWEGLLEQWRARFTAEQAKVIRQDGKVESLSIRNQALANELDRKRYALASALGDEGLSWKAAIERVNDLWFTRLPWLEKASELKEGEINDLQGEKRRLKAERDEAQRHLHDIANAFGLYEYQFAELADRVSDLRAENKRLRSSEGRAMKVENQALEIRRLEADRTRLKDELEELQDVKGDYGHLRGQISRIESENADLLSRETWLQQALDAKSDELRGCDQAREATLTRAAKAEAKLERIREAATNYKYGCAEIVLTILNDDGGRT